MSIKLKSKENIIKKVVFLKSKDFVPSLEYGSLCGIRVSYNNKQYLCCPMDISIHVMEIKEIEGKEVGVSRADFYLDNDELIDLFFFQKFISDRLVEGELEDVIARVVLPYLKSKNKI